MTTPHPPVPANRRSWLLDRQTVEADLAAALYFEAWPDDKDHAAHKAALLAEHLWPAVEHQKLLLEEAQRAGLIWRHEAERRAERIARLCRAVADLRARLASVIDGHVPETCAHPGRTVCFECGCDWPCATFTAAGGSPDSWPSHDR